jgi:hypothetical protein
MRRIRGLGREIPTVGFWRQFTPELRRKQDQKALKDPSRELKTRGTELTRLRSISCMPIAERILFV